MITSRATWGSHMAPSMPAAVTKGSTITSLMSRWALRRQPPAIMSPAASTIASDSQSPIRRQGRAGANAAQRVPMILSGSDWILAKRDCGHERHHHREDDQRNAEQLDQTEPQQRVAGDDRCAQRCARVAAHKRSPPQKSPPAPTSRAGWACRFAAARSARVLRGTSGPINSPGAEAGGTSTTRLATSLTASCTSKSSAPSSSLSRPPVTTIKPASRWNTRTTLPARAVPSLTHGKASTTCCALVGSRIEQEKGAPAPDRVQLVASPFYPLVGHPSA